MKKVAIISLPLGYNYGGELQTYALMEILRRYNYDVEFILRKREKEPSLAALLLHNCKQLFETLGLSAVVYYLEKKTNSGLFFKTVHLRSFQKKYKKEK